MHASISLLDKLKWNLDINIILSILLVDIGQPCLCRGQCSWDFFKRNGKNFSIIIKLFMRCPLLLGAMQGPIKYILSSNMNNYRDFGPGVQRSWLSVQIAYDQSFSLITNKKMSVSFSYIHYI